MHARHLCWLNKHILNKRVMWFVVLYLAHNSLLHATSRPAWVRLPRNAIYFLFSGAQARHCCAPLTSPKPMSRQWNGQKLHLAARLAHMQRTKHILYLSLDATIMEMWHWWRLSTDRKGTSHSYHLFFGCLWTRAKAFLVLRQKTTGTKGWQSISCSLETLSTETKGSQEGITTLYEGVN